MDEERAKKLWQARQPPPPCTPFPLGPLSTPVPPFLLPPSSSCLQVLQSLPLTADWLLLLLLLLHQDYFVFTISGNPWKRAAAIYKFLEVREEPL